MKESKKRVKKRDNCHKTPITHTTSLVAEGETSYAVRWLPLGLKGRNMSVLRLVGDQIKYSFVHQRED